MKNNSLKRNFIPGENWVYYKVYCGSKTAETLLRDIVKPIADGLLNSAIIDKWFYIRYTDPKPHLRLRFHITEINNISIVLQRLSKELSTFHTDDLVWKIQLDTYQREIERYGENTMELSESFFHHDSSLIINLLEHVIDDDEELRWQISLLVVNNLLSIFDYSIDEKLLFMETLRNGFANEFALDKYLTKQLDTKYRNFREAIDNIMQIKTDRERYFYTFVSDFNKNVSPITETVIQKKKSQELDVHFDSLISSYIHMSMVRLFKSKNRLHELVVYDFLLKYYKTCVARGIKV